VKARPEPHIGLVTFLINLVIVIAGVVGAVFLFAANLAVLGGCLLVLAVTAVIMVSFISTALNQIFRVALYQYAVTGSTAGGFDSELLRNAFDRHGYRPPSTSTF
jgi:hypothetical protein